MTEKEKKAFDKACEIAKILDDKKAQNIKLLYVRRQTVLADYFVIATGSSTTQVNSLCDEVDFKMKEDLNIACTAKEGHGGGSWIVMDYDDVIVHVFHNEAREFYKLDKLWADATEVDYMSGDTSFVDAAFDTKKEDEK